MKPDVISSVLCVLALGALAVLGPFEVAPVAADCVDDASDMRLRLEMTERGYDRWGCWTTTAVVLSWDAPATGSEPLYYVVNVEGRGRCGAVQLSRSYVFANDLETWWPAWVDTLQGTVYAVGTGGRGEASPMSLPYLILHEKEH